MKKDIIKLTEVKHDGTTAPVIIGVPSIIRMQPFTLKLNEFSPNCTTVKVTKIESRHAMVVATYVLEPLDDIYNMINKK